MAILLFVCIFAMVCLALLALTAERAHDAKQAERRLAGIVAGGSVEVSSEIGSVVRPAQTISTLPWLERLLNRAEFGERLALLLYQADLNWSPGRLVLITIFVGFISGYLIYLRTNGFLAAFAGGAVLATLPFLYVRRKRDARFNRIRTLLPEALDMMVAAIRAGHSFSSAMGMVARDSPEPVRREFRKCYDEQHFGLDLRAAMLNLTQRTPLRDIRVIVTAVLIQRETGGNLTEILDKVAHLIREDFRLQRQVMVHTAQGRITGWILAILPIILGFILYLLNPDNMRLLWTRPIGVKMLYGAAISEIIGTLLIRRIIRIEI